MNIVSGCQNLTWQNLNKLISTCLKTKKKKKKNRLNLKKMRKKKIAKKMKMLKKNKKKTKNQVEMLRLHMNPDKVGQTQTHQMTTMTIQRTRENRKSQKKINKKTRSGETSVTKNDI